MTDAEYEEQKARVQAIVDRWLEPLGLRWWHIEFEWQRQHAHPDDDDSLSKHTTMTCSANWRYRHATITAYLPCIAEIKDERRLEWIVLHEFMHVFLSEARMMDKDDWLDHEERIASDLASAFQWVRERFHKDAE